MTLSLGSAGPGGAPGGQAGRWRMVPEVAAQLQGAGRGEPGGPEGGGGPGWAGGRRGGGPGGGAGGMGPPPDPGGAGSGGRGYALVSRIDQQAADGAIPGLDGLQLRDPHLGDRLHAAAHAAAVLHAASLHQLLYQRLHIDVEPLGGAEVRVAARVVEDDLTDALLHQLVVGGPHQGVVPDADQVLQDGEEVGLGRGVHHQVLHQLETLIHIVQLQPNIVEPLKTYQH